MNSDRWKIVKKYFHTVLGKTLPQFLMTKERVQAGVVYEWVPCPNLRLFICLTKANAYDEITIELAWSAVGKPFASLIWNTDPIKAIEKQGAIVRMGKLWTNKEDVWWAISRGIPTEQNEFPEIMQKMALHFLGASCGENRPKRRRHGMECFYLLAHGLGRQVEV